VDAEGQHPGDAGTLEARQLLAPECGELRPERSHRRLLEEVREDKGPLDAEEAQRLEVHVPEALRVEVSVEEPRGGEHGVLKGSYDGRP
jgi:hypothetical protein